jgi:hypothetical protein
MLAATLGVGVKVLVLVMALFGLAYAGLTADAR